jgi:ribosomal protein L35AE/L33A
MKIFSVKYLLLACMASSLFCTAGCFPFPHKAKGFTVQGEVRDNFNNDPVPDVRVEIELPGERFGRMIERKLTPSGDRSRESR